MEKAYMRAKTALTHANAAITETRKCGLGYPTHTYVDCLYEAALALDRFLNQHDKARREPEELETDEATSEEDPYPKYQALFRGMVRGGGDDDLDRGVQ